MNGPNAIDVTNVTNIPPLEGVDSIYLACNHAINTSLFKVLMV